MIALIDADLVAFRCAASAEENEVEVALYRVDNLMQQILDASDSTSYNAYLTGAGNFRKKINPEYKANRRDKEPPRWLQQCRSWLCENWKAVVSQGCVADDLLGIAQTDDTIICSLDKDLRMIPGMHFNWIKMQIDSVNQQDALRHFWKQMLIGDTADNIFGIRGIGPKKAEKIIEHLDDQQDMFEIVYSMYNDPQRFAMNAACLWIQRKEDDQWDEQQNLVLPDDLRQEVMQMSEFMKSLKVAT